MRALAAALVAAFFMFGSAQADDVEEIRIQCVTRSGLVEILKGQGYRRLGFGFDDRNAFIELFVRDRDRRWGLVVTGLDGISCPVEAGHDWQPDERRI